MHTQMVQTATVTSSAPGPDTTSGVCSKCGARNPNDYSFCTACGTSLEPGPTAFVGSTVTALGTAVKPVRNEQTTDEVQRPSATDQAAFRGIGGWLLLFCMAVTIVGPLINLAEILQSPNDSFVVVFDLGLAAFKIYTGITVWRVRPNALKVVKVYFIVMLVVACLSILGSFSTDLKEIEHRSPSQDPLTIGIQGVVGVAIWWSYFRKSKRVKATFGSNL